MAQADVVRDLEAQPASEASRNRPWAVTAIGLLMFPQALILLVLGVFYFGSVYLLDVWKPLSTLGVEKLYLGAFTNMVLIIIFISLALLSIMAAIGLLRLWRNAWTNAMLAQGLTLLVALILYLGARPWYIYILMLYSVFMVLYLNHYEVKMAFRPGLRVEEGEEAHPQEATVEISDER